MSVADIRKSLRNSQKTTSQPFDEEDDADMEDLSEEVTITQQAASKSKQTIPAQKQTKPTNIAFDGYTPSEVKSFSERA